MFIELTDLDGSIEFVNVNCIKRIFKSCNPNVGSNIEWTHALGIYINPTDYISQYKETPKDVFYRIYYARHEEGHEYQTE